MRDDFAKVLVERPRHGHQRSFGEQRHTKSFKNEEMYFSGRESMKKRYDSWSDRKSFNEHLNPLKGWLRSVVGKSWDKSYSELRQKFDARSVINNHILQHLWSYVERNAYIEDGKVVAVVPYNGVTPIEKTYSDFYVCPKDGTLKMVKRRGKRAAAADRQRARDEKLAETFRVLNNDLHLRLIDGVWYVLEVKNLPMSTVKYQRPSWYGTAPQLFKRGWRGDGNMVSWTELNEQERQRYGVAVPSDPVVDVYDGTKIYKTLDRQPYFSKTSKPSVYQNHQSEAGDGKYYASKRTASHKQLKEAGISGASAVADDVMLSHREAAKYRRAA